MLLTLRKIFRSYFLTGLLVLGPLVISGFVIKAIIDSADSILLTSRWLPFPIPGLGVLLAVVIILLAGFLAKNVFGKYLFAGAGEVVGKIPFVGTIYSGTKQIFETLLSGGVSGEGDGKHFGRVVIIPYPSTETFSLAFVTSEKAPDLVQKNFSEPMLSVYVPTTPNPTSGFYLQVPARLARSTDLSVEEGFKVIVSLGLVHGGH